MKRRLPPRFPSDEISTTFKAASAQPALSAETIGLNVQELRMIEAKTLPENETPTLGTP
jgi:hypothetical protein